MGDAGRVKGEKDAVEDGANVFMRRCKLHSMREWVQASMECGWKGGTLTVSSIEGKEGP